MHVLVIVQGVEKIRDFLSRLRIESAKFLAT